MKEKIVLILEIIVFSLVLWTNITSAVLWIREPRLTKMQVTMRIPKSFVLNFDLNK